MKKVLIGLVLVGLLGFGVFRHRWRPKPAISTSGVAVETLAQSEAKAGSTAAKGPKRLSVPHNKEIDLGRHRVAAESAMGLASLTLGEDDKGWILPVSLRQRPGCGTTGAASLITDMERHGDDFSVLLTLEDLGAPGTAPLLRQRLSRSDVQQGRSFASHLRKGQAVQQIGLFICSDMAAKGVCAGKPERTSKQIRTSYIGQPGARKPPRSDATYYFKNLVLQPGRLQFFLTPQIDRTQMTRFANYLQTISGGDGVAVFLASRALREALTASPLGIETSPASTTDDATAADESAGGAAERRSIGTTRLLIPLPVQPQPCAAADSP